MLHHIVTSIPLQLYTTLVRLHMNGCMQFWFLPELDAIRYKDKVGLIWIIYSGASEAEERPDISI